MKHEEDFHQLTRRFGRYKKVRIEALKTIRGERMRGNKPDEYAGWEDVREKVLQMRAASGYDSEEEEKKYRERKGKGKGADHYGEQTTARGG